MAFGPSWTDREEDVVDMRVRRERKEAQKAQEVQGGQSAGRAVGGLVGTGVAAVASSFGGAAAAPAIVAASSELGGQIGRKASGGEFGYDSPQQGAAAGANLASAGVKSYTQDEYFDKMDEIINDPQMYAAWEEMPGAYKEQMSRGDFSGWNSWWKRAQ
jgi:hypothetical protein